MFIDNNANGIKEANERFYSNAKILTKHNADSVITFTFNGSFSIETDTGLFVSKAIAPLNYYNIVPVSHTSVFSTYLNTDNVRFGLQPINGKRDLAIYVIPENTPRPGFPVRYRIFYKNQGTDTLTSGTIKLVKSNLCNFASASPLPANVVGDTLWWNISNLKPMDTASIYLQLTVLPPPTVNLNDVLNTSLSISIAGNEQTPNDNVDTIRQVVRNSYDPNDKAEIHGGKITALQIANGEYLQYIIRFQNTGNDTAFNVYIRDTLDNKLDWSTFSVIDASSNFQLSLKEGNKCQFTFPNIMLPDSNTNEPLSHGYLVYIIKPKTNLVVGNVIKNKAAIYFDYNLPVITNTEKTEVVAEVYPLKLVNFSARKSHSSYSLNGEGSSQVLLNWTTANEVNTDYFDIERSNSGKEFISIGKVKATANSPLTTFYSFTDKSPLATANYYRLKIVDKDGKFEYSPIRMIGIMGSFSIRIYPNPAKDKLQLQIDNYRKQTLQVEVISQDGKVVLSTNIYQTEGSILRSISTTQLQKGMYSVRVFSKATTVKSEDEQQILTFEKM